MPVLKNIQMGRAANKLRNEFEYLWSAPAAYRPGPAGLHPSPFRRPVDALYGLADAARRVGSGATAGDVNVLANQLLWAIDEERSYARAFDLVMAMVLSGELRTVAGPPMGAFLSDQEVAAVLELVAVAARPEAYEEHVNVAGASYCDHVYARFEPEGVDERLVCETCRQVLDPVDYQDASDDEGDDEGGDIPAAHVAPPEHAAPPIDDSEEDGELYELEQEVARLRAAKRRAELKAEIASLRAELDLDGTD